MAKPNLRIAATFDDDIALKYGVPGLKTATIIDDAANLIHEVQIEYEGQDDQMYRRLNYAIVSMQTGKLVAEYKNEIAQQLLYKIAIALSGSTLINRNFQSDMIILSGNDVWDDELPSDELKPKAKRKAAPKKEGA